MALREAGRCAAVGGAMKVDAVAAAVRGRDAGNPAVGLTGRDGARRQANDRSVRHRLEVPAPADVDSFFFFNGDGRLVAGGP